MYFIDPILVKLHCCSNKNKASSSSCIHFFLHAVMVILITIAYWHTCAATCGQLH